MKIKLTYEVTTTYYFGSRSRTITLFADGVKVAEICNEWKRHIFGPTAKHATLVAEYDSIPRGDVKTAVLFHRENNGYQLRALVVGNKSVWLSAFSGLSSFLAPFEDGIYKLSTPKPKVPKVDTAPHAALAALDGRVARVRRPARTAR